MIVYFVDLPNLKTLEDGDVPLIGSLTSETSFLVPYLGSISFDFSRSFDHCFIITLWYFNITMENHHFQWVNQL